MFDNFSGKYKNILLIMLLIFKFSGVCIYVHRGNFSVVIARDTQVFKWRGKCGHYIRKCFRTLININVLIHIRKKSIFFDEIHKYTRYKKNIIEQLIPL